MTRALPFDEDRPVAELRRAVKRYGAVTALAGIDVEARRAFWTVIAAKAAQGRSVLLTTHYLEEADALADRIVMIGRGRVIAEGSPAEIKARVVGRRIRCRTALPLAEIGAFPGVRDVRRQGELTELMATEAERAVFELLSRDPALSALEVRGADLEEAFLSLTQFQDLQEVAA